MFDKLNQLKQIHELQNEIKKERYEREKEGIKVVINGAMELEEITLNPELSQGEQEQILKDLLNEAMKAAQMAMAQKFRGML